MAKGGALLAVLQHGDSFFPSGQVSFSLGLEELAQAGRLADAEAVRAVIEGQLLHRWARSDRLVLAAAHRAKGDLEKIVEADRLMEASQLGRLGREGSRQLGAALLGVHERLGTKGAADYRAGVRRGDAPGHQAAVQGLVWWGVGLSQGESLAVGAHGFAVALIGAALRLGLIGHLDGQRILLELRAPLARLVAPPVPGLERISAYAPSAEIAMMRHETRKSRLFSN
jgi:urease accessory protein